MKPFKFLTGIFFLVWALFSIVATSPIWLPILAYDIGNPLDYEDRAGNFIHKVCFLNRDI